MTKRRFQTNSERRVCLVAVFVIGLVMFVGACAGTPRLLGKSKPREIVLAGVRNSAWAQSPVLEVPPFVLYGDRTAIYTRDGQYWTAQLTPAEVQALWQRLRQAGFFDVPTEITLTPNHTDSDVGRIVAQTDRGWRMVRIYNPDFEPKGCPRINSVRREFLSLNHFQSENEMPWIPDELGLQLIEYSHARGPDIPWPIGLTPPLKSKLPSECLEDPDAVCTYFHRMPAKEHFALANLLIEQARRDRAAVALHSKKWAVHYVPFVPGILELFRALDRYSDWPWGFDYGEKPTSPCREARVAPL